MDTVLVSKCLCGCKVTYEGKGYRHPILPRIGQDNNFLAVCPEMLGGLTVPREGCRVVVDVLFGREPRVLGRESGVDFTFQYQKGAERTLDMCRKLGIRKAYLLENSPSCGKNYGLCARLLEENGIEVVPVSKPHTQEKLF